MNLQDLIKAARSTVVDQRKLDELKTRLSEANEEFKRHEHVRGASNEFLSRTYNL